MDSRPHDIDNPIPARHPEDIDLAEKVAFLSDPANYPEQPGDVVGKETHMSWVFLTDRHAYKLKKPVKLSFLDFSTLALRHFHCDEEVRLNRRLSPHVYLGTVSLNICDNGRLCLGYGQPVDWLVKMLRLPEERTLHYGIRVGEVSRPQIRGLAERLAAFHRTAERPSLSPEDYCRRLREDAADNAAALKAAGSDLPNDIIDTVAAGQETYLTDRQDRLVRRVEEGRIVEGHGDLRPEHVYLGERLEILDCLEFNRAFRTLDTADELAYLAMECTFEGDPRVAAWLFDEYADVSGDTPPEDLTAFYKCHRAMLRAKLAIWHLDNLPPPDREKWTGRARQYLELARAYGAVMNAKPLL